MNLTEYRLSEFIQKTQDTSSLPGGGSICALNGSLAASLSMMVIRLSKKNFSEEEREFFLKKLQKKAAILEENIQLDGESYSQVLSAKALSASTPSEYAHRAHAIEAAYIHTTEVPLSTMEGCLETLEVLAEIKARILSYAMTDLFIAADLAFVSIEGAQETARLNIGEIEDEETKQKFTEKLNFILSHGTRLYNLIKKG